MVCSEDTGGEVNGVLTPSSSLIQQPISSSLAENVKSPGILQQIGSLFDQGELFCPFGGEAEIETPEGGMKGNSLFASPGGNAKADQENNRPNPDDIPLDESRDANTPSKEQAMNVKSTVSFCCPVSTSCDEKDSTDHLQQGDADKRDDHHTESKDTQPSTEQVSTPVILSHESRDDHRLEKTPVTNQGAPPETPMDEKLMKDEDYAFLPDEFKKQLLFQAESATKEHDNVTEILSPSDHFGKVHQEGIVSTADSKGSGTKTFTLAELQARVADAVEEAERQWQLKAKQDVEAARKETVQQLEKEAENQLIEHGSQWMSEHEEEIERLKADLDQRLEEERRKSECAKEEEASLQREESMKQCRELMDRISSIESKADQDKEEYKNKIKILSQKHEEELKAREDQLKSIEEQHKQALEYQKQEMEQDNQASLAAIELVKQVEIDKQKDTARHLEQELEWARSELLSRIASVESKADYDKEEYENKVQSILQKHGEELKAQEDKLKRIEEENQQALESQKKETEQDHQACLAAVECKKQAAIDEQVETIRHLEQELDWARAELLTNQSGHDSIIQSAKQTINEKATEIQAQKEEMEALRKEMNEKLLKQKLEFESEAMASDRQHQADLQVALEEQRGQHTKELEVQKEQYLKTQNELEACLERTKRDASDNEAHSRDFEKELKSIRETHHQEMQKAKEIHENDISRWKQETQSMKEELEKQRQEMETMTSDEKEKQLQAELEEYKTKSESDRKKYESELKKIRDGHASEIDDMLKQLDLIEVEHNQRSQEKEKVVSEKEAIIAALGSQLAEANATVKSLDTELRKQLAVVKEAQEDAASARQAVKEAERKIERLCVEHKKAMELERKERHIACEKVKEEMIAAAEEQFGRANETYLNLKHEYESSKKRISKLERDITAAKKEADTCRKEQATKEAEASAELAQLKASLAACEANIARKAQSHRREIESLKSSESEMRMKLEEATSNCSTAHMSLATVVAEKERLTKELDEMKSVCEELISMVEGSQQDKTKN